MTAARLVGIGSVLMAFSLTGCTSVTVRRVTPQNENRVCGTRYYLPQPFVVASPKADGSLSVKVEYLPDPTQQYAVCTWSALATHDLTLKLTQGMLSEVKWVADSSAVAAEAVKVAGEVQKTAIEARLEAEKSKQTKVDETSETRRTERREAAAALRKEIAAAEVALAEAEAKYNAIKDNAEVEAKVKVDALATRDAASAKLDALEDQCAETRCREVGGLVGGDVLLKSTREQVDVYEPARSQMPGPVMFRVVPDETNGVRLEPVLDANGDAQRVYAVYSVGGATSEPAPGPPATLKVDPTDLGEVNVGTDPQERTLTFNMEFDPNVTLVLRNADTNVPAKPAELPQRTVLNSKQLKLKFTAATPPGRYDIRLTVMDPKKPTVKLGDVVVNVRIVRS